MCTEINSPLSPLVVVSERGARLLARSLPAPFASLIPFPLSQSQAGAVVRARRWRQRRPRRFGRKKRSLTAGSLTLSAHTLWAAVNSRRCSLHQIWPQTFANLIGAPRHKCASLFFHYFGSVEIALARKYLQPPPECLFSPLVRHSSARAPAVVVRAQTIQLVGGMRARTEPRCGRNMRRPPGISTGRRNSFSASPSSCALFTHFGRRQRNLTLSAGCERASKSAN